MSKHIVNSLFALALLQNACAENDPAPISAQLPVETGGSQAPTPGGKTCDGKSFAASDYSELFDIQKALQPGDETEVCVLRQVGDEDIYMNYSDMMLSHGSHHGLLWLADYTELPPTDRLGDPIEVGKLVACQSGANGRFSVTQPISGSQGLLNTTAKGIMPSDVAIKVPAKSYVVLDLHMLNATDKNIDACMMVGLSGIPQAQVAHNAGILYYYSPFITVPARSSASSRMACPITQDIQLKSGVSHMHKSGVGYKAQWLDGDPLDPNTKSVMTLYESTNWNDPADKIWDAPLAINKGSYIDYICNYKNDTDHNIAQGLETTDEMCQFIGTYWPYDRTLALCGKDIDSAGAIGHTIGDGSQDGAGFLSCFWRSDFAGGATQTCGTSNCTNYDARYHFQSCFTSVCPAVSRYTRPFSNCVSDNNDKCSKQCADSGGAGTCAYQCLQTACAAESAALTSAKCQ